MLHLESIAFAYLLSLFAKNYIMFLRGSKMLASSKWPQKTLLYFEESLYFLFSSDQY